MRLNYYAACAVTAILWIYGAWCAYWAFIASERFPLGLPPLYVVVPGGVWVASMIGLVALWLIATFDTGLGRPRDRRK